MQPEQFRYAAVSPNPKEVEEQPAKGGYTLVICEKPDAAKRIAESLGGDRVKSHSVDGVLFFRVEDNGRSYVICSASGHLYTVSDTYKKRAVYPVLDLHWVPTYLVDKKARSQARISAISKLAEDADVFVNSCDFDLEGETIGYNILRYACGGKEHGALRAKFSTLTEGELKRAFDEAQPSTGLRLAEAGRTRHMVDFVWGVNLSRALTESYHAASNGYRNVTIGRVQGPTLAYIVDRENEIRSFVPVPYWQVTGVFQKDDLVIEAQYEKERVDRLFEAQEVQRICQGKIGIVNDVNKAQVRQPPPAPFNLGDLQREAYRVFGFSPSATLRIAEALYLDALISYPRTSSQKLPKSIDYGRILDGLSRQNRYHTESKELLAGRLHPQQGPKDDPAHPAIYPTGELPRRLLESREFRLYDLIVKRFFAVFGQEALTERLTVLIDVEKHLFRVSGRRLLVEGWIKYYRPYYEVVEKPIPLLARGECLVNRDVKVLEKHEQSSRRYNQSSLLQKMEAEAIGTKATRADVISTLFEREYISGQNITATDIGFSVIEALKRHSPLVVSSEMTREVEANLEKIESGSASGDGVIEHSVEQLLGALEAMKTNEIQIGEELRRSVATTLALTYRLGSCPSCKTGELRIIRSKATKKRFVGCTNYRLGCKASAPLPQRGSIKATNRTCKVCLWPIVSVYLRRFPWRFCLNTQCPSKKNWKKQETKATAPLIGAARGG